MNRLHMKFTSAFVMRVQQFYFCLQRPCHVFYLCCLSASWVSRVLMCNLRTSDVGGLGRAGAAQFFCTRTVIFFNFGAAKLSAILARAHLIRGAGTGFIYRWYLYHHYGSSGPPVLKVTGTPAVIYILLNLGALACTCPARRCGRVCLDSRVPSPSGSTGGLARVGVDASTMRGDALVSCNL